MRFKICCETGIKCHIKVFKHLLPSCCQEKITPKKFASNSMKQNV